MVTSPDTHTDLSPKETGSPAPPISPRTSAPNKPHPVPRPRHSRTALTGKQIELGSPAAKSPSPLPRHRSKNSRDHADGNLFPAAGKSPLSGETEIGDSHTTHLVGGVKLLPNGVNSTTPILKPVPKPRRPRVQRKDVNSGGSETTGVPNSAHKQNGDSDNAKTISQLGSEDLGSEGDRETGRPDGMQTSLARSHSEERDRDGLHKGEGMSSQEGPYQPRHVTRHVTGNKITTSDDVDNQTSMSNNIAKLRLRANSIDEAEAGLRGRAWSIGSNLDTIGKEERTWSIGSAGITSPSHAKNGAPMV